MNCKVCGKELIENTLFCGNCGAKLEELSSTQEVVNEKTAEMASEIGEAVEAVEEVAAEVLEEASEAVEAVEEVAVETATMADITSVIAAEPTPIQHAVEAAPVQPEVVAVAATASAAVGQAIDKNTVKAQAREAAEAAKAEVKAAKAAAKEAEAALKAERKRYMVRKNPAGLSVLCVFLSLVTMVVMFMTSTIAVLSSKEFDDFYYGFISDNRVEYDSFWIVTSMWYLYAVAAVLLLLVLLIFSLLKKRKYAILNYVGIPMIVNGAIFTLIALLNEWIADTFDLPELLSELFDVISDEAKNIVLFAGIIMIAAGALLVLIYVLISSVHKAVYRKKCMKAENNQ